MNAEHLSIDGSRITLEAEDVDLSQPVSSTGWVLSQALMQAHPVTVRPPGYREVIEEIAHGIDGVEIVEQDEVEVEGGSLRVAVVRVPVEPKGRRTVTVGYWEGETGSMSTSLAGERMRLLVEVFAGLGIRQTDEGAFLEAPVLATPRPPMVVKAVPEVGVLAIRPAISQVLEQVPRRRGLRTAHGELFRSRQEGRGVLLVGPTSVVSINPSQEAPSRGVLDLAERLRVEWALRPAA